MAMNYSAQKGYRAGTESTEKPLASETGGVYIPSIGADGADVSKVVS